MYQRLVHSYEVEVVTAFVICVIAVPPYVTVAWQLFEAASSEVTPTTSISSSLFGTVTEKVSDVGVPVLPVEPTAAGEPTSTGLDTAVAVLPTLSVPVSV